MIRQIRSVRSYLNSLELKALNLGEDEMTKSKEIVRKLSMIIINNAPLNQIDTTPDTNITTFGIIDSVKNEEPNNFTQISDKSNEKIKKLEEDL
jgi:DNA mismatch repair ATPase MutS